MDSILKNLGDISNSSGYEVYNNFTPEETKLFIKDFFSKPCCESNTYIYIDNRPGKEKIEVKTNC